MPEATRRLTPDQLRRLKRVAKIARFMDTALRIPGTGIRFGGDAIVGLLPVIGDSGAAVVQLWAVNEARRLGMPKDKLARMVGNVGVDTVVGSIPILGSVFDVYFKASRRNLQIILEHFGEEHLVDVIDDDEMDISRMKDITPGRKDRR
ncbi:DUF4112 domain-containing protein [Fulvimarina endophytica]|uniref:DUF4112 domain-containing protein n=1 Tax=Fulvimarina endophytica TaxID=2293836 RepID=A0A371X0N0_9HYPH|nr:DUF4112 domain-containing protein [Fulvimarina endophytica]RFC62798.1 DUF4112 domain-containing protein [Fulvimarina endophytica]